MSNRPLTRELKQLAKDDAIRQVFRQMYVHKMRYEPRQHKEFFNLTDLDVADLERHFEECQYPARLVVVNLPTTPESHKKAIKASSKVFMDEVLVTYELGSEGKHPHYNFLFMKNVEWLALSLIVSGFANTFGVAKNYIDVTELTIGDYERTAKYIEKENLWKLDKRSENSKKQKNKILRKK